MNYNKKKRKESIEISSLIDRKQTWQGVGTNFIFCYFRKLQIKGKYP